MSQKHDWSIERRWVRYKADLRLKVSAIKAAQRGFTFAQGSDISEGGMAAYIPSEFEVGDVLQVELKLPYSTQPMVLHAHVRNRNGFRYGLEYSRISDEDKALLVRSLKALSLTQ